MPGDLSTLPQLPPIPPQTPSASEQYPWERHYPPSSWSTSTIAVDFGRSKSTSPGTRLYPLPVLLLLNNVGPSTLAEVVSPPPRSQSRPHSHSRSCSRVLVLPSASTAEPIVISPPPRTHSRSASAAMSKLPPRPSTTDPAGRVHTRTKSRPLPLPLPPKDILPSGERVLVRTESLPLPKLTPISAPAASQPVRHHTSGSPQPRRPDEAVPSSAPALRGETRSRMRSRATPGVLDSLHPSFPLDVPPPIPASVPARAPTPPRPKPRVGLPATPRRQDDNRGTERGRSPQVSVTMRMSPARGLEQESSPRPKRSPEELARKWVLEKKGKRLTQDTMFVAQQLRLLR
ncbi:hypothetical protein OH77DRAFT_1495673 [Trametes cingulata]|nr:hypothetical protein OH77DRAFT_1495673 [Trametes cingulata]